MNRIKFWAFALGVAVFSLPAVVQAQAAPADSTVNDIVNLVVGHYWWALGGAATAVILHAISSNSEWVQSINLSAAIRGVLVAILGGVSMFFDGMSKGEAWAGVLVTAVLYVVPQLLHFLPDLAKAKSAKRAAAKVGGAAAILMCLGGVGAAQTGCASLIPILTDVITYVQDASAILNVVLVAEKEFFQVAPNPSLQKQIEQKVVEAQLALDTAIRTTRGVKDLSSDQVDAAFAEFRQAYASLVDLLKMAGVVSPTPDGKAFAAPRGLLIPTPLAMGKAVTR
jgi:hypothetical protein